MVDHLEVLFILLDHGNKRAREVCKLRRYESPQYDVLIHNIK